ncbi:hypothetical protein [Erwinia sp. HR93]|uniref:hypothetical protein n=1 Tax=Erwinia sp. HR93 TaxID=3094840 RepID=UPI002ADEE5A5|nr:hypothetical protein [Erwinia sp. HR93]MEA1063007.1 hypothetical protein [Erwinia sp. HR93]
MLKKYFFYALVLLGANVHAAEIRTDLKLTAKIENSVRVYIGTKEVTGSEIDVPMAESGGYMTATTPPFIFVGNVSGVRLKLEDKNLAPKSLANSNGDLMTLTTLWLDENNGTATTNLPMTYRTIYPDISAVTDLNKGPRVSFKSEKRVEFYPLGTYTGMYSILVTPIP